MKPYAGITQKEEAYLILRRHAGGCCSRATAMESGCVRCSETLAAIDFLRDCDVVFRRALIQAARKESELRKDLERLIGHITGAHDSREEGEQ